MNPYTTVTCQDLKNYAQVFFDHFSKIYDSDKEYFQVQIFERNNLVAIKFAIVESEPSPNEQIIFTESTDFAHFTEKDVQNPVLGFEADYFYIVKSNHSELWQIEKAKIEMSWFINEIDKAELDIHHPEMKEFYVLKNYAQVFFDHFSKIYDGDGEYFQINIFIWNGFVAMKFMVVPQKPNEQIIFYENDNICFAHEAGKILGKAKYGFEKEYFWVVKPRNNERWGKNKAQKDLKIFHKALFSS